MGSGKTACLVRELVNNKDERHTFSNIITKKLKNNHTLQRDNIIHKEVVAVQKNGKEVCKYILNDKFWKELHKKYGSINVVLDEAHTLVDPRRSMSAINKVMSDFMALLRRILGNTGAGYGVLTLITQLGRNLDVRARELATEVHYHICHFIITCKDCGVKIERNNEQPEHRVCEYCGSSNLIIDGHIIEKFLFQSFSQYEKWYDLGMKAYYDHFYITDIAEFFNYYDTFQWDNLITDG